MTTTPAARDERELFEAEILDSNEDPDLDRRADGDYCNIYLQQAWCGWQQRAALAESELAELSERNREGFHAYGKLEAELAEVREKLEVAGDIATHNYECVQLLLKERDELRAELERVKKMGGDHGDS